MQRERVPEGRTEKEVSRGAFEDYVDEKPPKYWKKIVVTPEEAAPTVTKDGAIAKAVGQWGYSLINSKTVGALTLRVGVAEFPPGVGDEVHYWHNCEEVLYIMEGSGEVEIEGEKRTFKAGDAIFIPFRGKHRTVNTGNTMLRFVFIVGIRMRPYEGLTESSIDYREFYLEEDLKKMGR